MNKIGGNNNNVVLQDLKIDNNEMNNNWSFVSDNPYLKERGKYKLKNSKSLTPALYENICKAVDIYIKMCEEKGKPATCQLIMREIRELYPNGKQTSSLYENLITTLYEGYLKNLKLVQVQAFQLFFSTVLSPEICADFKALFPENWENQMAAPLIAASEEQMLEPEKAPDSTNVDPVIKDTNSLPPKKVSVVDRKMPIPFLLNSQSASTDKDSLSPLSKRQKLENGKLNDDRACVVPSNNITVNRKELTEAEKTEKQELYDEADYLAKVDYRSFFFYLFGDDTST
jgi:hypothetical protein